MPIERHYCPFCLVGIEEDDQAFCCGCGCSLRDSSPVSVVYKTVVKVLHRLPHKIIGRLGEQVLLEPLGNGGMGLVFKCMHIGSGQFFALKIHRDRYTGHQRYVDMLVDEAKQQQEIVHYNVVRVFGVVQDKHSYILKSALDGDASESSPTIVFGERFGYYMELLDGCTLLSFMQEFQRQRTAIPWKEAIWLCQEMIRGLKVVHEHGYVHADIKPSNFLYANASNLCSQECARFLKVADFGIAQKLSAGGEVPGYAMAGTEDYMSHEQRNGVLTYASDIYSLGVVFRQLFGLVESYPNRWPMKLQEYIAHMQHTNPKARPNLNTLENYFQSA